MKNSAEAEKWINHLEQKLNQFANPPKGGVTTMPMSIPIGRDEAKVILELIAREKELSSLTDEVIKGIVYDHCNGTWDRNGVEVADEVDVKAVGKAIRDYLKQNHP